MFFNQALIDTNSIDTDVLCSATRSDASQGIVTIRRDTDRLAITFDAGRKAPRSPHIRKGFVMLHARIVEGAVDEGSTQRFIFCGKQLQDADRLVSSEL